VVAVAAGGAHSLALKADGAMAGWGDNEYGQLTNINLLTGMVSLAGGDIHSLFLNRYGQVEAVGDNGSGQCNVPPGLNLTVRFKVPGRGAVGFLLLLSD
jgi:alpha-tubulin suppressor-like RCC1 family protein